MRVTGVSRAEFYVQWVRPEGVTAVVIDDVDAVSTFRELAASLSTWQIEGPITQYNS